MKSVTLYKRNVDGSVQQWTIEREGNKYRSVSGRKDGQKVTSEWTSCFGKNTGKANATTDEEQAEREALALIQKKRDKGYNDDAEDLDSHGIIKPMLAAKYADAKRAAEVRTAIEAGRPVYVQPKLDGVRCLTTPGAMMSRQWKPLVSAPHILRNLQDLFADNKGFTLDGELYTHKLRNDFDTIISLARTTDPTAEDLRESEENLEYHVYDVIFDGSPFSERTFSERWAWLVERVRDIPGVKLVVTSRVSSLDEMDEIYGSYLEDGYEGQMIRVDGPYECNKRSKFLLKRKEFVDEEFTICDVREGIGNRQGCPVLECITEDNKLFRAALKCNVTRQKSLFAAREELIGEQATVRYQNMTKDGVPRFPVAVAIRDHL